MLVKRNRRGQSSLELAILFAVVIIAFVALQHYVRNAAAGRLKSSSDSISQSQFNPLTGTTGLTVNRVTNDRTYSGGDAPDVFGGIGTNGNAGRMESETTQDDSVRTDN